MCGIAGILKFNGTPVTAEELSLISDKIEHRGRDSEGIALGKASSKYPSMSTYAGIGLAHRRLAIIDLSASAAQPMSYNNGKLCLVYNGEIYNYIELKKELETVGYNFRTNSDTEVILASYKHWGEDSVRHFNGMFAFALWDEDKKQLFCARDPIGIKPFYYLHTSGFFAFASESSALVHLTGKSLNQDAIAAYFLCMYVPGTWSIFEGVSKLPAGHTLTITHDGSFAFKRFWQLGEFSDTPDSTSQRRKIKQLLSSALKRQLRSDVPVGVFLSGGIDSSLVVALASEYTSKLHTFSVGYEGHTINELPHAAQIAARYGTKHHEFFLKASDEFDNLNKALSAINEPVADSAILPSFILSEMAVNEGVKVLLNGTGGDEVFGGYDRYIENTIKIRLFESIPYRLRVLFGYLFNDIQFSARFKSLGFDMVSRTGGCFDLSRHLFSNDEEFKVFIERLVHGCFPQVNAKRPLTYNKMLFDLGVYLPDELLVLLDQMTMAWTLEGRVPFLDIDLVKESFRFPVQSHVLPGRTKILLRELSVPYLGSELAYREKQGFGGPVGFWVKQNGHKMLDVVSSIRNIPYFGRVNIDKYSKTENLSNIESLELFHLYCFAKWHERLRNL
jgi:asparagine synthase (glutamine-hydrolysing)